MLSDASLSPAVRASSLSRRAAAGWRLTDFGVRGRLRATGAVGNFETPATEAQPRSDTKPSRHRFRLCRRKRGKPATNGRERSYGQLRQALRAPRQRNSAPPGPCFRRTGRTASARSGEAPSRRRSATKAMLAAMLRCRQNLRESSAPPPQRGFSRNGAAEPPIRRKSPARLRACAERRG